MQHQDQAAPTLGENTQATRRLVRIPAVLARTGLSESHLHRLVAAGKFPAPIRVGPKFSAWPEEDVDRWLADLIAERDIAATTKAAIRANHAARTGAAA